MRIISNSVKAQFQAKYLYQPVWLRHSYTKEHPPIVLVPKLLWQYEEADGYLQLRSVSDLTDEEAIQVAKFQDWEYIDKADIIGETKYKISKMWLNFLTADYLRSIGIALPFTYLDTHHPITLSVQEQVELGIIKIR